jgi:hypothetical protein
MTPKESLLEGVITTTLSGLTVNGAIKALLIMKRKLLKNIIFFHIYSLQAKVLSKIQVQIAVSLYAVCC